MRRTTVIKWKTAFESGTVLDSRQQPETKWWHRFDDNTLTGLVKRLAESNLNLARARERILEAYARRGITEVVNLYSTLGGGGRLLCRDA